MPYTPVFSQGVKFIKIARIDKQGKDNTLSLQELNSIRIDYSDTNIIEYPITSISKYDDYFLFGVATTNATSSTDNYILDYRFKAGWTGSLNTSATLTAYNLSGSVSYDNLNYFNTSSGQYILGNQPNIPITITSTASISSNTGGNVFSRLSIVNTTTGLNIASSSIVSTNNSTQIVSASFSGVLTENTQIGIFIFTDNTTQVTSSFFVTQSINPTVSSSDLVVLQPYIDEDFFVSEYNVLAGNAVIPRYSALYMDVDYTTNTIKPVNFNQIISGSATRAAVQDSNYTTFANISPRYIGSKTNSINYNIYTPPTTFTSSSTSIFGYSEYWPGDQAFGKQTSINVYSNYFAKFINITSSSPELPGTSKIYITELIDTNGNIYALGQNHFTLDVAYNFYTGTTVGIYNITGLSASFAASSSVIDGGAYYQTILYSTGSTSVNTFPTFATFVKSGTGYTNIDGTNNFHSAFTASSPNVLSAVNSNNPAVLKNWLYGFLTSSFQDTPLAQVSILGTYAGIYNTNANTVVNGYSTEINIVNFSDIITPIQTNDYIRIGTTSSLFFTNSTITASQTFQITNAYIDPSSDGLSTGSLTLNGNINNLPSALGQAYIIYRRVPSDSYIIIDKEINSNSTGLIIPVNFNPAYDPIKIARDAGII